MGTSLKFKRSGALSHAIAAGVVFAVATQFALAQQAEDSVQRVEITGSSIKRVESEGALPVQTFTRAEIERSGASTATELIQKLPAMQGFVTSSESVGGGGGGFASASLRSLGQRTLVLLNGRRLATWAGQTLTGYGDGIDLNTIPLAAIERIEVLTDGASALYGSDAIAGVVNFITRSNYEKLELSGTIMKPKLAGGEENRLSLTKGFGELAKDGFNVMLAYNTDKQEAIKSKDRPFAATGNIYYTMGDNVSVNFGNFSSRGIPANIRYAGGWGNPYLAGVGPYAANAGTCPAAHFPDPTGVPVCWFDYVSTLEIQPKQDRQNLLLSGSWKLGESTAYAEFVHTKSEVLSKIAPPPVDMPINDQMSFWGTFVAPVINDPAITTAVARWRLADAGNRTILDTTTADHLVVGMKGFKAGWDYDASLTHSKNKWVEDYVAGWMTANGLVAALSAGTLNPFLEAGQQSAAGNATIESAQYKGKFKEGSTTLQVATLRGSREAFAAPGGVAMVGVGVDFRTEQADYKPSDIAMGIGDNIAGDTAAERPFDVSRNAWGAFAELQVPIRKGLEATASVRQDNYSDFGGTTNVKGSVRWQPNKQWLVRGSAGTGYKAPAVPQTANVQQHYGVTGGNYLCPAWILADATLGPLCLTTKTQYDVFAAGSTDLKPETSKQFSLGTRFEPNASLSFGVDFWRIGLKDRLGQVDETLIFSDPAYQNLFTIYNDPILGQSLAIIQKNANMGKARAKGLDYDIVARTKLGASALTSRLLWTHMIQHEVQDVKGGPFHSDLGVFATGLGSSAGVVFTDIVRWSNTVQYGGWSHALGVNFKSGYIDQNYSANDCYVWETVSQNCIDSDHRVKAYYTFDWQTSYQMAKSFRLLAGIVNIADRAPPLSLKTVAGHQLGFDNRYTDPRGRTLYLTARYEM